MSNWINKTSSHKKQNGAALLTVLVSVMIITLMTMEFQFNSLLERKLSYNELNQMQAYYLAKSGARIGLLRVGLYGRVKRNPQLKTLGGGSNIDQYLSLLWSLPLPPFPPPKEKGALDKLDKQDKDASEKVLDETRVSDGTMTSVISTESAKINLNYLVVPQTLKDHQFNFRRPPENLVEHVGMQLVNLMDGFIRDSDNPADEYGPLRPEGVVYDIMDWVNQGETTYGSGNKDAPYERMNPPYKAKRGRFFTLEELRLVHSIDTHLYEKLRPHVTVYSYDGKININQASNTIIRVLYPDFTDDDLKRLSEEKARLGNWPSENAFVDFIVNNLGRAGFKTLYNDDKNYPFTVATQSFIIESLGTIKKSKSEIQKMIRVAVTLTQATTPAVKSNIKDPDECNKDPNMFFDLRSNNCTTRPKTAEACTFLAGQWVTENGKQGCKLNNQPVVFPPAASTKAEEPNAMKILSWIET